MGSLLAIYAASQGEDRATMELERTHDLWNWPSAGERLLALGEADVFIEGKYSERSKFRASRMRVFQTFKKKATMVSFSTNAWAKSQISMCREYHPNETCSLTSAWLQEGSGVSYGPKWVFENHSLMNYQETAHGNFGKLKGISRDLTRFP
jgi:hypothetical protein